jgi:hypothetical protein
MCTLHYMYVYALPVHFLLSQEIRQTAGHPLQPPCVSQPHRNRPLNHRLLDVACIVTKHVITRVTNLHCVYAGHANADVSLPGMSIR